MSLLDPPPLETMMFHEDVWAQPRRGQVFVFEREGGPVEMLVADYPVKEGAFWRFRARRNVRPNA